MRLFLFIGCRTRSTRGHFDIQQGDATDYYLTKNTLHLTHLLHQTI
jgi:hypothetical protein